MSALGNHCWLSVCRVATVTIWLEKCDLCLQGLQASVQNPWKFCCKNWGMMAEQDNKWELKDFTSLSSGEDKWNSYLASRTKGIMLLFCPEFLYSFVFREMPFHPDLLCILPQSEFCSEGNGSFFVHTTAQSHDFMVNTELFHSIIPNFFKADFIF